MLLLVMVTLWWQRRLSGMWIGDGCGVPIVPARLRLGRHPHDTQAIVHSTQEYIRSIHSVSRTLMYTCHHWWNSLHEFVERISPDLDAWETPTNLKCQNFILKFDCKFAILIWMDILVHCIWYIHILQSQEVCCTAYQRSVEKFHTSPALEGGLYFILKTVALSVSNKPSNMHPHWGPSSPLD